MPYYVPDDDGNPDPTKGCAENYNPDSGHTVEADLDLLEQYLEGLKQEQEVANWVSLYFYLMGADKGPDSPYLYSGDIFQAARQVSFSNQEASVYLMEATAALTSAINGLAVPQGLQNCLNNILLVISPTPEQLAELQSVIDENAIPLTLPAAQEESPPPEGEQALEDGY